MMLPAAPAAPAAAGAGAGAAAGAAERDLPLNRPRLLLPAAAGAGGVLALFWPLLVLVLL